MKKLLLPILLLISGQRLSGAATLVDPAPLAHDTTLADLKLKRALSPNEFVLVVDLERNDRDIQGRLSLFRNIHNITPTPICDRYAHYLCRMRPHYLGFASFSLTHKSYAYQDSDIGYLSVNQEYRRHNVGKRLVNLVLSTVANLGWVRMGFLVSPPIGETHPIPFNSQMKFYQSLGFNKCHGREWPEAKDAAWVAQNLTESENHDSAEKAFQSACSYLQNHADFLGEIRHCDTFSTFLLAFPMDAYFRTEQHQAAHFEHTERLRVVKLQEQERRVREQLQREQEARERQHRERREAADVYKIRL